MSIRLHADMSPRDTIQEALDALTQIRHRWVTSQGNQYMSFYDTVTKHLSLGEALFDMPTTTKRVGDIEVYIVSGKKIPLHEVSKNFIVRILFELTQIPYVSVPLFATLRLAGIPLPNQAMCCAAGAKECTDVTSGYTNMSRGRVSWFKLLMGMGFPIVSDGGELIKDDYGNSIVDVVADWNVINLLRELVRLKVTHIKVLPSTEGRFRAVSGKSNSVRKSLALIQMSN